VVGPQFGLAGVEEDGHAADGERVDDAWVRVRVRARVRVRVRARVRVRVRVRARVRVRVRVRVRIRVRDRVRVRVRPGRGSVSPGGCRQKSEPAYRRSASSAPFPGWGWG